jgi:hypothetical protein
VLKVIGVLGAERSGISRVTSLLSGFDGLSVKEDIFNPKAAVSLEAESGALGQVAGIADVTGSGDPRLLEWMRENPGKVIDWLVERANGKVLVFKLLDNQLVERAQREALLKRSDFGALMVRRSPIDIYISLLKTHIVKAARYVDTTNVQVTGQPEQYLAVEARRRVGRELSLMTLTSARRPVADVSYASEIARDDAVLADALARKLTGMGLSPGAFSAIKGPKLVRQDRGTLYPQKMTNWAEFAEALKKRGIYFQAFQE